MISSITKGPRQSNIELLRIFAMFLVLIVHADFWSLGAPKLEDYRFNPLSSITRASIQSCAIICVNIFICISGWFGIKSSIKGLATFLFQSIFLVTITYFFAIVFGVSVVSCHGIRQCLLLDTSLWFILAYTGLYILAPILNKFCETATNKQFLFIIIPFFIFQTIYGISGAAKFIINGYSVFSFVGLYLLVQYIRKYCQKYKKSIIMGGGIALIINTLGYVAPRLLGYEPSEYFFSYISPLVIWTSISTLLLFQEIHIKTNKIINWVSKSVFAVYIIHQSPFIAKTVFKPQVQLLYEENNGVICLISILSLLLFYFIISVILDKFRIILWSQIAKRIKWPSI